MILWILLFTTSLWAKELSLITFNLHGYHPMGEERRYIQKQNSNPELSWSHLHYFKEEEISRGLDKRQKVLASHLNAAKADIIFLQEVGGGLVHKQKNCQDFQRINVALDLRKRMPGYNSWVGCRGNLGWWTDPHTFDSFSILTEKTQRTIMSTGDNPYPFALLMEGLAILTGPSIKVLSHVQQALPINDEKETFFLQLIKFQYANQKNGNWWIAANIHGGHKVQHFEQAVATRRYLSQYLHSQPDKHLFKGFVIAGDFNAQTSQTEVSSVPWSFAHAWQTREGLTSDLLRLNRSDYKPFATLSEERAQSRIRASINRLFEWFSWNRHTMDGSLNEVALSSSCQQIHPSMNPFCQIKDKIDHIYVSDSLVVKSYSALYRQNNWTDLENTTSDHPGLAATLEISDQ